jgi:hypothetical protein
MELRQIRSFLSIAETLHFGRTAEMLQSALISAAAIFLEGVEEAVPAIDVTTRTEI